jgi:hypothetical protein
VSDQWASMLVGFAVVVGLRLLDWAFPKGAVWRKVREWSEPNPYDDDDTRRTP